MFWTNKNNTPAISSLASAQDIFRESLLTYKQHFNTYATISVIGVIGVTISLFIISLLSYALILFGPDSNTAYLTIVWIATTGLSDLIIIVAQVWVALCILYVLSERVPAGQIGRTYNESRKQLLAMTWVAILVTTIIVGGLVMFVLPGIILFVLFSLAVYVNVIENKKGLEALFISYEYIKKRWFVVAWRIIFAVMAGVLVTTPISFILKLIDNKALSDIVNLIVRAILIPFFVIYSYHLYKKLRELNSNIDIVQINKWRPAFIALAILGGVVLFYFSVLP